MLANMGNQILYRLLACLLAWSFISVSVADEFKLQFSKDFMEAESRQLDSVSQQSSDQSPAENQPVPAQPKSANTSNTHDADYSIRQPKQNLESSAADRSLTSTDFSKTQRLSEITNMPEKNGQLFGTGVMIEQGATQQLINSQEQNYAESYAQMRDDLRALVGDEVYSKMIWAYQDLKEMDASVYAELSEYEVMVQEWLIEVQEIFGLNDQLRAELVLPDTPDAEDSRLRVAAIESHHDVAEDNLASRLKADRLNQDIARAVDFENQSKLFQIIKYLTIKNLFYLLLSIVGAVYFAKFFKFLVRQQ
jgi:hypothetical protein